MKELSSCESRKFLQFEPDAVVGTDFAYSLVVCLFVRNSESKVKKKKMSVKSVANYLHGTR